MKMRTNDFCKFIVARERCRFRKETGQPKPWTQDPILQSYRFCNVERERDTESQWIAKHWRGPHNHHPDLWFGMMVARFVNWHETLEDLTFPKDFNAAYIKRMRLVLKDRIAKGQKVWTGAYLVSTNGRSVEYKHDYFIEEVFGPAWANRSTVRPKKGDTLASFFERLVSLNGLGTFMAGQIIADVKYATESPMYHATDWYSWATPGPGSKRGLNRVMGRDLDATWLGGSFLETLGKLRVETLKALPKLGLDVALHAQDLQNCLCEFDKYERVRLGQGRPRSRYDGKGEA